MEKTDIQAASTYINNLLLSRGLLRDGKSVDFARLATPASTSSKTRRREDEVEVSKMTAQVMNLVHGLILKCDRDQSQQEHIAQTLLTLRAESVSTSATISRLTAANSDLQRQIIAEKTAARAAHLAARAAESSARSVREEVTRVKISLAQVRTQCSNDVRKRDLELSRLKAHLSGQQRGSANKGGGTLVGPSCSINQGSTSKSSASSLRDEEQPLNVHDAEYNLRRETTEFLTQLSQSLSDENDVLIALLRGTLATLRELQGMRQHGVEQSHNNTEESELINSTGSSILAPPDDGMVKILALSYDTMAAELAIVLDNLRDLLTNPSFAPIEEVQIREEEIQRLREGWEKMEGRWQEAVIMMHGWRKRMLRGGDTVNLDELKEGLNLGEGLDHIGSSRQADTHGDVQDESRAMETNDSDVAVRTFDRSREKSLLSNLERDEAEGDEAPDSRIDMFSPSSNISRSTISVSPSPLKELPSNVDITRRRSNNIRKTVSFQRENKRSGSDGAEDFDDEDELTRHTLQLNVLGNEGSHAYDSEAAESAT